MKCRVQAGVRGQGSGVRGQGFGWGLVRLRAMGSNLNRWKHFSGAIEEDVWTNCSLLYLARNIERFGCLKSPPSPSKGLLSCGNWRREEGEQCDCGPPEKCVNPCCNSHNCTLKGHAVCSSGPCCDLKVRL